MSNQAKKGFNVEEHTQLSNVLRESIDRIQHELDKLVVAYAVNGKEVKRTEKSLGCLMSVKHAMEDDWYKKNGDKSPYEGVVTNFNIPIPE